MFVSNAFEHKKAYTVKDPEGENTYYATLQHNAVLFLVSNPVNRKSFIPIPFFFGAGDLQLLPQRLRELDRPLRNLLGSFDLTDPNQVVDPPTDQCSVISAGLYFQMETVTVTSLIRLNQVNKTTANEGRPAYGMLNYSVSVYIKSLKL